MSFKLTRGYREIHVSFNIKGSRKSVVTFTHQRSPSLLTSTIDIAIDGKNVITEEVFWIIKKQYTLSAGGRKDNIDIVVKKSILTPNWGNHHYYFYIDGDLKKKTSWRMLFNKNLITDS